MPNSREVGLQGRGEEGGGELCSVWTCGCASRVGTGIDGWSALKDHHAVGQVCSHYEIVLHYKRCLLRMQNKPETSKVTPYSR